MGQAIYIYITGMYIGYEYYINCTILVLGPPALLIKGIIPKLYPYIVVATVYMLQTAHEGTAPFQTVSCEKSISTSQSEHAVSDKNASCTFTFFHQFSPSRGRWCGSTTQCAHFLLMYK